MAPHVYPGLDLTLYLVTSSDHLSPGATVESTVQAAVKGGVTTVQLREKELPTREFLRLAVALREICHAADPKVTFIVNDRIDIALSSGADGVHLGQEDMPIEVARSILGPAAVIGISTNTIAEALEAANLGATYLGIGTCWATGTKVIPDHKVIGQPPTQSRMNRKNIALADIFRFFFFGDGLKKVREESRKFETN